MLFGCLKKSCCFLCVASKMATSRASPKVIPAKEQGQEKGQQPGVCWQGRRPRSGFKSSSWSWSARQSLCRKHLLPRSLLWSTSKWKLKSIWRIRLRSQARLRASCRWCRSSDWSELSAQSRGPDVAATPLNFLMP